MQTLRFKLDQQDTLFLRTIRGRVHQYFLAHGLPRTATPKAYAKAAFLLLAYVGSYLAILGATTRWQLYLAYGLMGMLTIFVALNMAHDAAHGTFSNRKWGNELFLYTFDLLGVSGYMWRLKHVYSHHPHVNIPGMDGDIKQSQLVRIFPDAPFLRMHRWQYMYMPFLYLLYTLNWLLIRDFKDFVETDISGKPGLRHPWQAIMALVLGKAIFLGRVLVLPMLILPFSTGDILLGFLVCTCCASATVAMALISAHVGEYSVYPAPGPDGRMPHSWVRHQLITTCDFATDSWLVTHLFGGFNHHVIHHLFPHISHIHYPALTQILRDTCTEFGMPYAQNPSLWAAMRSHFRFLHMRSKQLEAVPYLEM